jgi:hypothetical protein
MSTGRNKVTDAEIEMIERIAHAAGYREAVKDCAAYVARRDAKLASELRMFSRDAHLLDGAAAEPEAKADNDKCYVCDGTGKLPPLCEDDGTEVEPLV